MKVLLLLTFSLISFQLHAAEAGAASTIENQASPKALQAVIEADPKVQAALNQCYDNPKKNEKGEPIPVSVCLWSSLSPADKTRVQGLIEQAQKAETENREDGSDNVPLRSSVSGVTLDGFTRGDDPTGIRRKALDKLTEFYSKRLDEVLKSDATHSNVTDQDTFFELAKTQIGKNVITAWSAVCLDAGWVEIDNEKKLVIFSKAKNKSIWDEIRKANIAALSGSAGKELSTRYFACVAQLPMLCHKDKGTIKSQKSAKQDDSNDEAKDIKAESVASTFDYRESSYSIPEKSSIYSITQTTPISIKTPDENNSGMEDASRQRACETIAYVDGLRRQLAATEKVANIMKNDTVTNGTGSSILDQSARGRSKEEVDIDRVTTVTSGDLTKGEDSYYNTVGSNIQAIEDCKQNPDKGDCATLLANTQDEKTKLRSSGAAFMLETEILKEKLTPDKIASMSDDEKKELILRIRPNIAVDEVDLNKTLAELTAQFKTERESLIASLSAKVSNLELNQDANKQETDEEIDRLGKSLLSRGNEYVQLMHFNNIISGYFDVEDGKSNARVMDLELANVANLPNDGQSLHNANYGYNSNLFGEGYSDQVKENIRQNNPDLPLGATSENNEIINLTSDQIGQFIDYEVADPEQAAAPAQPPAAEANP